MVSEVQSAPVENRDELDKREAALKAEYEGKEDQLKRPDYWGGYTVKPETFEFWQGQSTRIHDRFLYKRSGEKEWTIQRLYP